jgi:hypothetical protein
MLAYFDPQLRDVVLVIADRHHQRDAVVFGQFQLRPP